MTRESVPRLGSTDLQVALAILRQAPNAYGVSVCEEIERRTGNAPSVGAVYAALERLEDQNLIVSRKGDPTPERGGRSKLYFTLTPTGAAAIEESLNGIDAMRRGLRIGKVVQQ